MPKNKAILYYFALTLYGFSANAAAQSCGGAPSGDVDGIWECIEYQDGTSNPYNAGPEGVWFGPAGTNSYTDTFNLETDLTLNYSFLTAQCPVTFETHFKRNSNNSLSIRVVNAYVYGTGMCNSISLSNFPWYASDTTSFSSTSSVDGAGNPGDIHPQERVSQILTWAISRSVFLEALYVLDILKMSNFIMATPPVRHPHSSLTIILSAPHVA